MSYRYDAASDYLWAKDARMVRQARRIARAEYNKARRRNTTLYLGGWMLLFPVILIFTGPLFWATLLPVLWLLPKRVPAGLVTAHYILLSRKDEEETRARADRFYAETCRYLDAMDGDE